MPGVQVQTKSFGEVKMGGLFVMMDIVMIKIDHNNAVALGHFTFMGFESNYSCKLMDTGMIPFGINIHTPVYELDVPYGNRVECNDIRTPDFNISFRSCFTEQILDSVSGFIIHNGKLYFPLENEDGFVTAVTIDAIYDIENDIKDDLLDSDEVAFFRGPTVILMSFEKA